MGFKVYINQGEWDQICDWVLKHKNIETGGDLFGLWVDEQTAVVQFVLGPGKDCRRTTTSFFQDLNYLREAGSYLTSKHGLCNVGQWHSHHKIQLFEPSLGDKNTVWNNMPGMGLNRYIVFIANITNKVTIKCFLFQIKNGRQLSVGKGKFEFLAGNSPLRLNEDIKRNIFVGAESFNEITTFESELRNKDARNENVSGYLVRGVEHHLGDVSNTQNKYRGQEKNQLSQLQKNSLKRSERDANMSSNSSQTKEDTHHRQTSVGSPQAVNDGESEVVIHGVENNRNVTPPGYGNENKSGIHNIVSFLYDPKKPIKRVHTGYGSNISKQCWHDETNSSNKMLANQPDHQSNRSIAILQDGGVASTSHEDEQSQKTRPPSVVKYIGNVDQRSVTGSEYDNVTPGKNETVKSSSENNVNHTSTELINSEITKTGPETPSATVKNESETVDRDVIVSEQAADKNEAMDTEQLKQSKKRSIFVRRRNKDKKTNSVYQKNKNDTKREKTKKSKDMPKSTQGSEINASKYDDATENASDKSNNNENHGIMVIGADENNSDRMEISNEEKREQFEGGSQRREEKGRERRRICCCHCFGRPRATVNDSETIEPLKKGEKEPKVDGREKMEDCVKTYV